MDPSSSLIMVKQMEFGFDSLSAYLSVSHVTKCGQKKVTGVFFFSSNVHFLSARDKPKYKEKVTNITMSMYKPVQRYFSKNCPMGYQRIIITNVFIQHILFC
jgi:hypothetical protein